MLIDLVLNGKINPGKVFDLTLPLHQVVGYGHTVPSRLIQSDCRV